MSCQTVTEKHKLNVPETMTEILDVSDEEGELKLLQIKQLCRECTLFFYLANSDKEWSFMRLKKCMSHSSEGG